MFRACSCSILAAALLLPRAARAFQGLPRALLLEEQQSQLLAVHTEQAVEQRQSFRLCHWGPEQFYSGLSARAQEVWNLALEESGLDAHDVSDYACNVPKMPWSWVEQIQAMDHMKSHTYNFQGSYMFSLVHQQMGDIRPQYCARDWLLDFVKENFTDIDLLKISDITEGYQPLGPYDKSTLGDFDSHHPNRTDPHYYATYDASYFGEMAASNFTLCPGGDRPWSMRFYEAIAAGSIPIINSARVALDTGAMDMWALWEIPYKYYTLSDGEPLVYRQDWVDHNMELFIKYQTFHQGDNTLAVPTSGLPKASRKVVDAEAVSNA
mmetsp:Transcript_150524/g.481838  ORF Transcript_150524/g.481838 Transcript_150524/m.481838 type:complete len:323 (+) Transcript_150524:77-1045(+)